jgi:hypothetical protein
MKWMIAMVAGSLAGGVGWWIGAKVGIMTAFFLSILATAVGTYYARRWIADYLP